MSHFFVVPTDENGLFLDTQIASDLRTALAAPFNFQDVYLYAHGWWTSPQQAMQDYNQFTIEFARSVLNRLSGHAAPAGLAGAAAALGVGVQWPSMLGQSPGLIAKLLEPITFYQMETRANAIGANAGYALLRSIVRDAPPRRRLNLIGHSFGCKVICSMLAELLRDRAAVQLPGATEINIVLLQAAFDDDDLEPDNIYGALAEGIPNARLLVTTSQLDKALGTYYPEAEALNLFRNFGQRRVALGYGGPTAKVEQCFEPVQRVSVGRGFNGGAVPARVAARMVVADLSALHADPSSLPYDEPLAGHHSDIFRDEIYALIAGFLGS